jgi:biopolymer transport protein ExbB
MFLSRPKGSTLVWIFLILGIHAAGVYAQGTEDQIKPMIDSYQQSAQGMTLFQMIRSGGFIMVVLGLLSLFGLSNIIYNFISLKISKLAPMDFSESLIRKLEVGDARGAKYLCKENHNIIARIVNVSVQDDNREVAFVREAMEIAARKEIGALWQRISYLGDIASVAPLIGLLGTVLGMIQAFNVIAFQSAVVKPLLLAGGVSKAMVTTAGGLIVAIPAMLFYSYFRGKVQEISHVIESYSTEIIRIIEEE